MHNDEIKVSVFCLAYNHEKYIRDALESFVMQKTDFKFEVIVHDDASTDGTADIIREYEKKYPEIIRGIYQKENQYQKKIPIISTYIYPEIRGMYVAVCEGDDYWTDACKLQMQYDIMEQNTQCSICTHKTLVTDIQNAETKKYLPDLSYGLTDGVINQDLQLEIALFDLFHASSWFVRKSVYDSYIFSCPDYSKIMPTGDNPFMIYMASIGNMYYINKEMSVYRKGVTDSWTIRSERTADKKIRLNINRRFQESLELCKKYFKNELELNLIQKAIDNYKWTEAIMVNDIHYILSKKNKLYREKLSKCVIIKILICNYIPWFENIWCFLKCLKNKFNN